MGKADLVCHDHHRHAFLGQLLYDAEDLANQLGSSAEVTSSAASPPAHRQGPGDCDALALPTREVRRIGLGLVASPTLASSSRPSASAVRRAILLTMIAGGDVPRASCAE